jgi:hypothetical protein
MLGNDRHQADTQVAHEMDVYIFQVNWLGFMYDLNKYSVHKGFGLKSG